MTTFWSFERKIPSYLRTGAVDLVIRERLSVHRTAHAKPSLLRDGSYAKHDNAHKVLTKERPKS